MYGSKAGLAVSLASYLRHMVWGKRGGSGTTEESSVSSFPCHSAVASGSNAGLDATKRAGLTPLLSEGILWPSERPSLTPPPSGRPRGSSRGRSPT